MGIPALQTHRSFPLTFDRKIVPLDVRGYMKNSELLQGTLDMLILRVLSREESHGWGIADRIKSVSKEVLSIGEGSLYPALYRMETRGWIASRWGQSENNRKAKFYSLTKLGHKQLEAEAEAWRQLSGAITSVMRFA